MHKTTSEVLLEAFKAKKAQAIPLLSRPLLLLQNRWKNTNFRMFLLDIDFTRPTALIFLPSGNVGLIVHSMEAQPVEPLQNELELIKYSKLDEFTKSIEGMICKGSAVEIEHSTNILNLDLVSHSMYKQFKKLYDLQSGEGVLLKLRSVKTRLEIEFISEAIINTIEIYKLIEPMAKPGTTETEINRLIHHAAVDYDMDLSFPPIVAAGPRGTDPHPVRYTNRPLEKGDRLIVDMGLWCHGYASDLTRTFHIGGKVEDLPWFEINEKIIKKLTTLNLLEMTPNTLGTALQEIVKEAGKLEQEKHSYGHGLGVEVHDVHPLISATVHTLGNLPLEDGMVFTMEPGFYDQDGGFRIEDDYLIRDGKAVKL